MRGPRERGTGPGPGHRVRRGGPERGRPPAPADGAYADGAYGAGPTPAAATGVDPPAVAMVRVEVADASACPPRPRCADDDTNGRGLELVDGLADRWGWQPEDNGKSIWCEVDRQAAAAPPTAYSGVDLSVQPAEAATVVPPGLAGGATRSEAGGSEVLGPAPAAVAGTVTTGGDRGDHRDRGRHRARGVTGGRVRHPAARRAPDVNQ